MTLPNSWNREDAIEEFREMFGWYLSAAAEHSHVPTLIHELWTLPEAHKQRILAAHLLSSRQAQSSLRDVLAMLRHLPPRVSRTETLTQGMVSGPVLWERSLQLQWANADPTVFVTKPPSRTWGTPATALLRWCATRILSLTSVFPPTAKTGISVDIAKVEDLAGQLLRHSKLRDASSHLPSQEVCEAVLKRQPQLREFVSLARCADEILSGEFTNRAIEAFIGNVLAPGQDAELLELWTGLSILQRFARQGASVAAGPWDSTTKKRSFANIRLDGREYVMEWQRSYWSTPIFDGPGLYSKALESAGLSVSPLRPDFIFYEKQGTRAVLVEVKFSSRSEYAPDRQGLMDALAYARDIEGATSAPPNISFMVVANNSKAAPREGGICIMPPAAVRTSDVLLKQLMG